MLKPGSFDASILEESSNGVRVKCNPADGLIIVGSGIESATKGSRNAKFERRWDVPKIGGDGTVGVTVSSGTVSAMCARWNVPWKYASWSKATGQFDTFQERVESSITADALVIGSGVGGAASAAALRLAGVDSIAMVHRGTSTTDRSSGVVWFPDSAIHNVDMLMEAAGADTANKTMLAEYIEAGTAALPFWQKHVEFQQFQTGNLAYDYTTYTTGARRGHSWQSTGCVQGQGQPACGSVLVQQLKAIAAPDVEVIARASRIEQQFDGTFKVTLDSGQLVESRIVVVATGGRGALGSGSIPIFLATNNNGFSEQVQRDLGIASAVGDFPLRYHLEFAEYPGGLIRERWFATDTCVPKGSGAEYDLCYDYSRRAQAVGEYGTKVDTEDGQYACADDTSGQYWYDFMKILANISNYPACTNTSASSLYAGMIDTKGGFSVDKNFESPQVQGLFAAGTSAAAFTGDAYFGPGATLGVGMVSGYVIGPQAKARIDNQKAVASVPDTGDGEPLSRPVPELFVTAVWILLGGVLAHLASSVFKAYLGSAILMGLRYMHYILMLSGVVIITVAVALAHNGVMDAYDGGTTHRVIGTLVLVWLWLQAVAGVWVWYRNSHAEKPGRLIQVCHRISGVALLSLVVYLYISGARSTAFKRHYQWAHATATEHSAYAYAGITALVGVAVFYYAWHRARPQQKNEGFNGAFKNPLLL